MSAPDISDSEWTVMEVLWKRSPLTASEVARALRRSTGWAVNTVRTLLVRLVDKGALRAEENAAGVREFAPAVEREVCVGAESTSFLDRVFQGAAKPLLVHFASHSKLTPDEVRELKRLLDQSLKNKS
jgi:BlaI family transcriptional regulator, penicillinase repressor